MGGAGIERAGSIERAGCERAWDGFAPRCRSAWSGAHDDIHYICIGIIDFYRIQKRRGTTTTTIYIGRNLEIHT